MNKISFYSILFCTSTLVSGIAESKPPKQFTDDSAYTLVFTKTPKRIISVAPSLTEIVGALGKSGDLIAVSNNSDYPEVVNKLPKSGSYVKPNVEVIVAMNPDLVLIVREGPPKDSVDKLRSLGIAVAVLDSNNFPAVMKNIRWIANVLDISETGESIASELNRKYAAIRDIVADQPKAKALYAITLQPVITVGSGSYIHDLIEDAGAINIAGTIKNPYPRMTLESIIALKPEIIFFSGGMGSEAKAHTMRNYWKRWSQIPAVKNQRLLEIDTNAINRAGPRIVEGLAALALEFHPEKAAEIKKVMAQ